ncbi:MAG: acyl-CoA dehydrogenase family protein [Rhizomicrobium sp.]
MTQITSEDLTAMTDSVRRLFAGRHGEASARANMETREGFDRGFWLTLVEMGLTGLTIDAKYGGLGGGAVEAEAIMEEAGAVLLGAPLLSGFIAAALIEAAGDDDAKTRLLPSIAQGRIAALGVTGDAGGWTPGDVAVSADASSLLNGHASFVLHGQNAELLFAVARTNGGFGIFEIVPDARGLTIAPLPTFDRTLRLARLTFENVPAQRIGAAGWDAVERALQFALVALAGEQAGGARRVLEMTTQYAKTRHQFGRAIGSFQAIKHMAADLLLETESATTAARAAAQALARKTHDADELVALAAFTCADAFDKVTADAIQMHGGIAFTWEHPAHLYLRRARADVQLFGSPAAHRELYLKALGA